MSAALLGTWASSLLVGLLLGGAVGHVFLFLSSVALAALAWRDQSSAAARRIAVGMSCCCVGDLFMQLGLIFVAIPAFMAGHAFYVLALLGFARTAGVSRWPLRLAVWGAWWLLCVGLWYETAYRGDATPAARSSLLVSAGLVYSLFLASTAGAATGVALAARGPWRAALGAALFVASDAVIATRMFRPELLGAAPQALRDVAVWLTYGPAQVLIVTSAAALSPRAVNSERTSKTA